jgi:hypothetical protein
VVVVVRECGIDGARFAILVSIYSPRALEVIATDGSQLTGHHGYWMENVNWKLEKHAHSSKVELEVPCLDWMNVLIVVYLALVPQTATH